VLGLYRDWNISEVLGLEDLRLGVGAHNRVLLAHGERRKIGRRSVGSRRQREREGGPGRQSKKRERGARLLGDWAAHGPSAGEKCWAAGEPGC